MKTNSNPINKIEFRKSHFLIIIFICLLFVKGIAQTTASAKEIEKLLTRFDLNYPGLENTKQFKFNPELAAKKLLNYYKTRTTVKHPITQTTENEEITERDVKWANDALQHIFVGQPAYESHFCGNDIDWSSSPVPDKEWVWQLNRMYFWTAMGKVYAKSGDEKYAKEWSKQLIDWVKKNPRDEVHNYAWRSIETGIRGYNWTGLFYRFLQSDYFTEETLVYFLNSLYDHAEFLMTVYRSKSNWGLMEAEGLAFIAINFPEFKDSEKWKNEAFRRFNNEINLQVYPDGHQRELAIGYHLGCINWFYRTYELAKLNGIENAFPDSYIKQIEKMCEVPLKLGLPDGTNVQFGDAWRGTPGQHTERYSKWAEMFERSDFLYLATNGKQGTAPQQTAFALKESGLYSMRSAWDKNATCLVLKCGPDGGGHCQPDNGTFVVYAGGRNLMPDGGSYIYSGNPEGRRWFRQTIHHQTLTLNGEDTKYAPKLLKWQPGNNQDILVVENASYDNLTHRRSIFFVEKKFFVVVDEATGTATGDVDIHFQLAPGGGDATFNHRNNSIHSNFTGSYNIFVQAQNQKNIQLTEEEGWAPFEYTKKEPRPAFRYRIEKNKNQQMVNFATIIVPYIGNIPEAEIENLSIKNEGVSLDVTINGKKRKIEYKLD